MVRPPAPSANGVDVLAMQLEFLDLYADLRDDRATEILAQLSPPTAFWASVLHLHPDHKKWTIELIDVALNLANLAEMRFKHALVCRRPIEYSPQVQPIILTPSHGTLPSGHSTEAHMIARLLIELRGAAGKADAASQLLREQLMRQAARVAINRTVAGVHFPIDSMAGQTLGFKLAEYIIARCNDPTNPATSLTPWLFNGQMVYGRQDFDFRDQYDTTAGKTKVAAFVAEDTAKKHGVKGTAALGWLWGKAAAEWT
jgi:hypothetical protein